MRVFWVVSLEGKVILDSQQQ
uniref:Uncharacterized protein n=1 Tax=Rhizophora mucronata TaxID=61149 RepID=A0A2P2LG39_RHIMU